MLVMPAVFEIEWANEGCVYSYLGSVRPAFVECSSSLYGRVHNLLVEWTTEHTTTTTCAIKPPAEPFPILNKRQQIALGSRSRNKDANSVSFVKISLMY